MMSLPAMTNQSASHRGIAAPGHAPVPGGRTPLRGAASHEAEGRGGARGGGADRVGPPPGWPRLRLLRQIRDQLVPGVEQFLLVDDVIAVEDGAALVSGQKHGDPLGDVCADQVARGGAAAVVKEAGRHPVSVFYSSLRLITINTITSCVFIGLQRIDCQPVPPHSC